MKVVIVILCSLMFITGCQSQKSDTNDSFVVYAPHPIEFIDPIIAEFENETGISVQVIRAGTGELLSRIEHEQEIGAPVGDVLWGGSLATLESKKELFLKYNSVNESSSRYKNEEGYITRFTMIPSVIMVNRNLIGDIEIAGYEDLMDERLKGKIAFANPAFSASSYEQLLNQLWAMGEGEPEEGWSYVSRFIENLDGNLLDSSSEVYNGVAEGVFIVGLTFEEPAAKYVVNGAPIDIVYPEEGTIIRPDGVSIIRSTDNVGEAKKFIDYLTSYETQIYISTELNRRTIRSDVPKSNTLLEYELIHIIEDDQSWSVRNKEIIIEKFIRLFEQAD